MINPKRPRYAREGALLALSRGGDIVTRMEAVARRWVDVWFDGYDDVLSEAKDALTSGTFPVGQAWSLGSNLTLKAIGATIEGYATLLGCAPASTAEITFDGPADTTDSAYFAIAAGFEPDTKGPLTDPDHANLPISRDQILVQSVNRDHTMWAVKLTDLKQGMPDKTQDNRFAKGTYSGDIVFRKVGGGNGGAPKIRLIAHRV